MGSAVAPRHAMPPPSRWARFDVKVDADTVTFAAPDTSSPPPLPAPASLASSTEPRAMITTAESLGLEFWVRTQDSVRPALQPAVFALS